MPIDAIQQIATSAARITPGVEGRVSAEAQAQTAQAFAHAADMASGTLPPSRGMDEMQPDPKGERRGGGSARDGRRRHDEHGDSPAPRLHEDGVGERIDLAA